MWNVSLIAVIRKHIAVIAALMLMIIALVSIIVSYQRTIQKAEKLNTDSIDNMPVAVLDATEYDWWYIERTQIVTKDFILTNEWNKILKIPLIVTSCGCTTIELWIDDKKSEIPAILEPSQSWTIKVRFDPDAHHSRWNVKRAVRIETSDPKNQFLIINLKANVR